MVCLSGFWLGVAAAVAMPIVMLGVGCGLFILIDIFAPKQPV
ncbi:MULTISPECIES: hypothetical protein [unclassified Haloferax]|nr:MULTISPECIES: hypothetical protein [unclassified Haloferax]